MKDLLENLASPNSEIRESALAKLSDLLEQGCNEKDLEIVKERSLQLLEHPEIQARTFGVLALEMLVRYERLQDSNINEKVISWYLQETDLRGYAREVGWLHAVAHGADYFGTCLRKDAVTSMTVVDLLVKRIMRSEEAWSHMEDARVARVLSLALQKEPDVFDSFIEKSKVALETLHSGERFGAQHNFRSVMLSLHFALLSSGMFSSSKLESLMAFQHDMTPYLFEKFSQGNQES
ncbi:DUF2785 domain-containing protein [Rothia amarae]|uniref:DUF2785 domain-containing protein n=1 Tax=Rothia amarae TaxID=169480 RepID=UPI0031D4C0B5